MTNERDLGELRILATESNFAVKCDALAYHLERGAKGGNKIMLASVAGPSTAIKAIHAGLATNIKATFKADGCGEIGSWCELTRFEEGYHTFRHKLALGVWHLLAIAKAPSLVSHCSDEGLWHVLRQDRFTTPLLRSWIPAIRQELESREQLTRLESFQCEPAMLGADTATLDSVVSSLVMRGSLAFAA